jgi:hypothetical protein
MPTVLVPIGIKRQEINKIFGSKNQHLFSTLLNSGIYAKYDEAYSFKRELEGLLFHYVPQYQRVIKPAKFFGFIPGDDGRGLSGDWFDYAFALLVICYELGEPFVSVEDDIELNDDWHSFTKLLCKKNPLFDTDILLKSQVVFDTPFQEEDEINTALLGESELHYFKMSLENLKGSDINETNAFFTLFTTCIETCLEKKLELIVFSFEKPED